MKFITEKEIKNLNIVLNAVGNSAVMVINMDINTDINMATNMLTITDMAMDIVLTNNIY